MAASEWMGGAERGESAQVVSIARDMEEKVSAARRFLEDRLYGVTDACVTSSFQASGVVVLDLVTRVVPEIPVLFLDTGYHFQETLDYRDRMAERLGLKLINVVPERTVAEQEALFGILNQTEPDRCCAMRKVEPLFRALEGYRVWVTGLRRQQSKSRTNLQHEESFVLPTGRKLEKLNPLAGWTEREVWQYAETRDLPLLPLYEQGYASIGCAPCTSLPLYPDDPRSGRWGGQKLECGIHVQP